MPSALTWKGLLLPVMNSPPSPPVPCASWLQISGTGIPITCKPQAQAAQHAIVKVCIGALRRMWLLAFTCGAGMEGPLGPVKARGALKVTAGARFANLPCCRAAVLAGMGTLGALASMGLVSGGLRGCMLCIAILVCCCLGACVSMCPAAGATAESRWRGCRTLADAAPEPDAGSGKLAPAYGRQYHVVAFGPQP